MTTLASQVDAAIGWTLAIRDVPAHNGTRATIARGAAPQHFAAAYDALAAAGHLAELPAKVRTGAVIACAIAADNSRIPNGRGPLAAAFRRIDSPNIGKLITLAASSQVPVASRLIGSLVRRAGDVGAPVNFFDLGRTLAFWDTGSLTSRREHRNRLIFDFHAPTKENHS